MGQSNKIMESSYGVNFLHKNECTQLYPPSLFQRQHAHCAYSPDQMACNFTADNLETVDLFQWIV